MHLAVNLFILRILCSCLPSSTRCCRARSSPRTSLIVIWRFCPLKISICMYMYICIHARMLQATAVFSLPSNSRPTPEFYLLLHACSKSINIREPFLGYGFLGTRLINHVLFYAVVCSLIHFIGPLIDASVQAIGRT